MVIHIEERSIQDVNLKSDLEKLIYNFFNENYKKVCQLVRDKGLSECEYELEKRITMPDTLYNYVKDVFQRVAIHTPIGIRGSTYKYIKDSIENEVLSTKVCEDWWEEDYGYMPHYVIDFAAKRKISTKLFILYTSLLSAFNYGLEHLLDNILYNETAETEILNNPKVGVVVFPQFDTKDRRERKIRMLLEMLKMRDILDVIPYNTIIDLQASLELYIDGEIKRLPIAKEGKYRPYYLFPIQEHSPILILKILPPIRDLEELHNLWEGRNFEYYAKLGAIMTAETLEFLRRHYSISIIKL